ncbi:MAG: (Fe-S)-binding protein, partial [Dehalococcoidia bacterium]
PSRFFRPTAQVYAAQGEVRARVALLSGCIMPIVQARTMEAAVRVLQRNGCQVVVPQGQLCCGALNLHSGDRSQARAMARRNIRVFLESGADAVLVASAGCGSAMKECHELLRDDPEYGPLAQRFSGMVQDITEFLVQLPLEPPQGELKQRVTYQDPCHLAHAQRIAQAPRSILQAIPGLEYVEMEGASQCCGAAGIYSIVQQGMARQLLEEKMAKVKATSAQVIATANPGCVLQLEAGVRGVGLPARVCHVVELLDEAYRSTAGA